LNNKCPETGYSPHRKPYCKCEFCRSERAREQREYRKTHPSYLKSMNLRKYKLSFIDFNKMLEEQNGVCFVCSQPELGYNQHGLMALAVDHNHLTGAVRKLLCHRCNRALGLLGDDVERVQKLADYRKSFD